MLCRQPKLFQVSTFAYIYFLSIKDDQKLNMMAYQKATSLWYNYTNSFTTTSSLIQITRSLCLMTWRPFLPSLIWCTIHVVHMLDFNFKMCIISSHLHLRHLSSQNHHNLHGTYTPIQKQNSTLHKKPFHTRPQCQPFLQNRLSNFYQHFHHSSSPLH